jgi:phenylacetate-CoA ligase
MVVSSNGKKIHGAFFHYMFKSDSRVRQFQVIQNHYDQLEIRIVTDESTPFNGEDRLRERICHEFETPLEITFRYVDAIEPESSGKYRWIICKVRG